MIMDDILGNLAREMYNNIGSANRDAYQTPDPRVPLTDDDLDFAPELTEGAVIRNADAAGAALRRLKQERAVHDQYCEPLRSRIEKLEERLRLLRREIERADNALAAKTEIYSGALRRWFDTDAERRELKASWRVPLPDGTLCLTKPAETLAHDDDVLLAYVKQHRPEFVRVKESVDWAELKKHLHVEDGAAYFADTGEIPDGVTVTEKPSEFKIIY